MIIVSDTSAISNLAAIGQINLLQQLYGEVIIPDAVFKELTRQPISAGGEEAKKYDLWTKTTHAQSQKREESSVRVF